MGCVCVCVCVVLILFTLEKSIHRNEREGRLGGSVVERLPSAQVMVPGAPLVFLIIAI